MQCFLNTQLSLLINKLKSEIKKTDTIKDLFKEYDIDLKEIDLIPVCFADVEVSARTEHAIIYLNYKLLETPEKIKEYLVHEITHYLQQTCGDKPTMGSTDDSYLDNPYEAEGFQNQTKFISETKSDDAAEDYIDNVLDHHEVPKSERTEKKKKLLDYAKK
jgi:hypothetical protein